MSDSEEEYISDNSVDSEMDTPAIAKKKNIVTKDDLPNLNSKLVDDSESELESSVGDESEVESDYDSDVQDLDDMWEKGTGATAGKQKNAKNKTKIINEEYDGEDYLQDLQGEYEDEETDEDDDDPSGENYLQKFDQSIKQTVIEEFHPELIHHNYHEIEALVEIRHTENGEIDPLHRTLPFLTKYEKARILGERAKQINSGAMPFVKVKENVIDGYLIALQELEERKIPFIIKRPLQNGGFEYWRVRDLELL